MKAWIRALSIRARMLTVIGAVTAVAMVTFGLLALRSEQLAFRDALAAEQSALAVLVANRSAAALLFDDAALARENLRALVAVDHVRAACLYRSDGTLFAAVETGNDSGPRCPARFDAAPAEQAGIMQVHAEVPLDGDDTGHLLLASSTQPLEQRLATQAVRFAASAAIAVGIALALALMLVRLVSGPIRRLSSVAEAVVSSGDTQLRADVEGDDELGHLAAAFNRMLAQLQEQAAFLRTQAEYHEVLFQRSPMPVVVIDCSRNLWIDCNDAAVQIYGFGSREATLAANALDVLTPLQYDGRPSAEVIEERLRFALAGEVQVSEWRHRRPDGSEFDAEVHLSRFGTDAVPMLLASLFDVTQRKRAQAELRQLNDELESRVAERTADLAASNAELSTAIERLRRTQDDLVRSERLASLGSLVAGVAHELNTPLGSVLLASSTLGDGIDELGALLNRGELKRSQLDDFLAHQSDACQLVQRNAQRAAELISRFKQVAVDQSTDQRRRFDLGEVVEEVMATLQPRLRKTVHRAVLDVPPGLRMDSYPGPLGQVLTNLVMNALIHGLGDRPGTIEVVARSAGDEVEIEVADDGVGILAEHLPRLFDPFFTTKLGEGGSGLGLHIVFGLVERTLGGRISVHSTPGQGARFCLRLPRQAPEAAAEDA